MTEARNRVGRQLTPLEQEIIHYAETTMTGAGLDPNNHPETFKDLIILFAGIPGDNQWPNPCSPPTKHTTSAQPAVTWSPTRSC